MLDCNSAALGWYTAYFNFRNFNIYLFILDLLDLAMNIFGNENLI